MPRQRLRVDSSMLSQTLGRILAVMFALALAYGGMVIGLLGIGFSAGTVESITGYRAVYDALTGITANDITSDERLIAGLAGLVAFTAFGLLAWRGLPRPYLARSSTRLADDDRGYVDVNPRALERAAEGAALSVPGVVDARGRHAGDRINLDITARGASRLPETLAAVREKARESLQAHGFPELAIDCTLTTLQRKNRRELA